MVVIRISVLRALWMSLAASFPSPQSRIFVPLRTASFVAAGLFFVGMTYLDHVGATFLWVIVMIALATCEIEATASYREKGLGR